MNQAPARYILYSQMLRAKEGNSALVKAVELGTVCEGDVCWPGSDVRMRSDPSQTNVAPPKWLPLKEQCFNLNVTSFTTHTA